MDFFLYSTERMESVSQQGDEPRASSPTKESCGNLRSPEDPYNQPTYDLGPRQGQ